MTEVPSLKERQVLRLGAQNPVETMTCRCQHPGFGSILNKRTDRSPGPPDSRIADATAGPSLCAPKNSGAGGAMPRDISVSGENESHPAPHSAVLAGWRRPFAKSSTIIAGRAKQMQASFGHFLQGGWAWKAKKGKRWGGEKG